jgi:hypothetical protein
MAAPTDIPSLPSMIEIILSQRQPSVKLESIQRNLPASVSTTYEIEMVSR